MRLLAVVSSLCRKHIAMPPTSFTTLSVPFNATKPHMRRSLWVKIMITCLPYLPRNTLITNRVLAYPHIALPFLLPDAPNNGSITCIGGV
ncbi:hypothetical protein GGR53DRAFT_262490 [Hypoxylon sp. FL1150]|nr:hypothetical protein GGR53DRAFT_262490 [Hypoxylon sp. FL1150]